MVDPLPEDIELQESVYGLAAAPDFHTNRSCFAARHGGLSRSEDGGITWRPAFESLGLDMPLPATSVALSPQFQHDGVVFAGVPGGILSSGDGGISWSSALLPSPPPFISALALSPTFGSDGIAFAGALEDGVFLTHDRGMHWNAWNIGLLDRNVLCVAVSPAFARDRTLFAGVESGIFYSTNGGRFWRETAFPIDAAPVLSLTLSPAFEDDGMIFAGTEAHGLFCSPDRGHSWRAVQLVESGGAVNAVLLSPEWPAKPHLLVLLDDALCISRDGGRSWSESIDTRDEGVALTSVAAPLGLDPGSPLLAGRMDGRVQRYTIGGL